MGTPKTDWKQLFQNGALPTIKNPNTSNIYTLTKFLGQGGFGTVFKARSSQLNQDFAIKLMEIRTSHDGEDFLEEVTAHIKLSRAPTCQLYLVCMYDAFLFNYHGQNVGAIVTEFMDGDLDKIQTQDAEIPVLMKTLIDGLSYIHSNGFAHRDLKPGNVLRKGNMFKISDLGMICDSKVKHIPGCSHTGTPAFASPISVQTWGQEVSLADEQKEDIWSLGMTLYAVIFGHLPSEIRTEADIANLTQEQVNRFLNRSTPYPRTPPETISGRDIIFLISRMLKVEPDERWPITQIRRYFNTHLRAPAPVQRRPQRLPLGHHRRAEYRAPYGFNPVPQIVGADGRPNNLSLSQDNEPEEIEENVEMEEREPEEIEENAEMEEREPEEIEAQMNTAELCRIMAQAIEYYQIDPEFAQELIDIVDDFVNQWEIDFDYLRDCWEMMADGLAIQQHQGTCPLQIKQMLNYLEKVDQRA